MGISVVSILYVYSTMSLFEKFKYPMDINKNVQIKHTKRHWMNTSLGTG